MSEEPSGSVCGGGGADTKTGLVSHKPQLPEGIVKETGFYTESRGELCC